MPWPWPIEERWQSLVWNHEPWLTLKGKDLTHSTFDRILSSHEHGPENHAGLPVGLCSFEASMWCLG